jgi:FkbM family methyltransferase
MLFFDIGANRGDASVVALEQGYKVIACEPAPRIYKQLLATYAYNPNIIPLKVAVSDSIGAIEFYEAEEDGLSSLNKDWLTNESMPYHDKPFRTIRVNTTTIDELVKQYGEPDLIKIDVEGAEWSVFKGMTKKYGTVAFEWTDVTIDEHIQQLKYLHKLGYTEWGPQFIEHHLQEPQHWFSLDKPTLDTWVAQNEDRWVEGNWRGSNLRPTADVGMCWVR